MSNLVALSLALSSAQASSHAEDPYVWLEEVTGESALDWVKGRNQLTFQALEDDRFQALTQRLTEIYDSDARIPYVGKMGEHYYNFWKDAKNPRGVWRRTSLEEFRKDEPSWEILLDLDALGKEEGVNWVWGGSSCLRPDYTRCLIELSRGGADAGEVREFDLQARKFLPDGFRLPEAKSSVSWVDQDTLLVGTDFGEGSLTESGYPRVVKRWKRGTPLAEAELVFEGAVTDVASFFYHDDTPGYERDFVGHSMTFYTNELFEWRKGKLLKVEKPDDANASINRDWLLLELRSDWEVDGATYKAGSLLAANYERWLKGKREITVLFQPDEHSSLSSFSFTKNRLLLNTLVDVRTRIQVLTPAKKGAWASEDLPGVPAFGSANASPVDPDESDDYWLDVSDYLTPSTLSLGTLGRGQAQPLKSLPSFFNTDGLVVSQHFATSKDGTKVPYFQVAKKDLPADGDNPTLLYGYGGFEIALRPGYSPGVGAAWLEEGGVYVVANIRGGGEYGPRWHQAALKENRHRAYEDFAAVAEDLFSRKVTRPERLGAMGGSNGGLLMGNMITLYPQLFGAIVCKVPLLDMKRFHLLLAGASWMGEYGDPDDPEQWKFIQTFSPYHNLQPATAYPPTLFTTSTRDDRVHPGHARKMAARMIDLEKPVLYYENIEGGHGGAADNTQRARLDALGYRFLWKTLAP